MINISVVFWDNFLRENELNTRIVYILKLLKSKLLLILLFQRFRFEPIILVF